MSEDIDTGSIAPPPSQAEHTVDMRGLDESELANHVSDLLASVGEVSSEPDGSVASLAAVWAISQVEEACGVGQLVSPQDFSKDDLASPATLSQMLYRQIRKQDAPMVAS